MYIHCITVLLNQLFVSIRNYVWIEFTFCVCSENFEESDFLINKYAFGIFYIELFYFNKKRLLI